nr:MAG TPA: hypothetical protein [Caudoviricetes sp.]
MEVSRVGSLHNVDSPSGRAVGLTNLRYDIV